MAAQYRGFAYPFQKGNLTFPRAATDEDLIRMSILQIMSTTRGERVMRPTFGVNVQKFVFANNTPFLESLITSELRSNLSRFEPRITVTEVLTERAENEITITVEYVIRATRQKQFVTMTEPTPQF